MRIPGALVPSLVLAAALTGCGGGEPSAESGSTTPSTTASDPSGAADPSSPTPTAPTSGTTDDGLTTPGSRLTVGDPASVFLKRFGEEPSGRGELRVTAIEEVPAAEVEAAGGPDDGQAVWLIRASLEITELDDDFGPVQLGVDLTGLAEGRVVAKADIALTDALECPPGDVSSTAEVGETVDYCASALAQEGQLVEAAWTPFETAYSTDGGSPIVWSP